MAFNNLGPLTYITGGGVHYWWYDRGGGDAGFQHAAADIRTPNYGPPRLVSDEQGKAKWNSGYMLIPLSQDTTRCSGQVPVMLIGSALVLSCRDPSSLPPRPKGNAAIAGRFV